jgi:tetratricopeptide (TPR) repeat protein
LNNLGALYELRGDSKRALEYYAKAKTLALPSAGLAHADTAREAQLCVGAEDPEQAFAACNRLLATSPSDFRHRAHIINSRGVAQAMLGDFNGAINDFNLVIRNWPNHSDAYNNRGFTYAKLGQFERAQRDFEMALSINPNNQQARDSLSKLAFKLAQSEQPRSQLVGDWAVENMAMGAGEVYAFRPDATYEHKIWQILPGTRRVVQAEVGTYAVQGSRLTLIQQGGGVRTFTWRTTRDSYVSTPMLFLQDARGIEQQFYGSR